LSKAKLENFPVFSTKKTGKIHFFIIFCSKYQLSPFGL
jgi:hypothetical protein